MLQWQTATQHISRRWKPLQATHSGEVQAAGGWDDMAVLCARTLKILEKEYMDETLTLQSVSERLHVSPNYLGANLKSTRATRL